MNGGIIVGECRGCKLTHIKYLCVTCDRYANPSVFVRARGPFMCPSAFHLLEVKKTRKKVRVGQQKQSKRW